MLGFQPRWPPTMWSVALTRVAAETARKRGRRDILRSGSGVVGVFESLCGGNDDGEMGRDLWDLGLDLDGITNLPLK